MLPLAHIYVSTKVSGRQSPLLVLGSVLPDISWTSKREIGRDKIHYSPRELYDYTLRTNPGYKELAVGVRLHSNVDRGADYYSDDSEVGFAYIEGQKILGDTSKLLGENGSEKSLVLAHNFIEACVDLLLKQTHPYLLELYDRSLRTIDLQELTHFLSGYLELEEGVVLQEIQRFLGFVGPEAYVSRDSMIDRMLVLIKQRRGKEVERGGVEKLLQKSVGLMKDKYMKYLDVAVTNMKSDFSSIS